MWVMREWASEYLPLHEANCAAVTYRGQDQQRELQLNMGSTHRLYLYHSLFSVTGTEPQEQPVVSKGGSSGLIFNGELYNLPELVQKWLPSLTLPTNALGLYSETDVLLALITQCWDQKERWQHDLQGMFALVAWHEAEVWAIQDPWQMKPLYQLALPDGIGMLYASHPHVKLGKWRPSQEQTLHYGLYRYPNGEVTQLERVPTTVPIESPGAVAPYGIRSLEKHLQSALKRHYSPYQQNGIMLSGGADSTLLMLLAHDQGLLNAGAYTVADGATGQGQTPLTQDITYAQRITEQAGIPLETVVVEPTWLWEWPNLLKHMEYPVADVSALLTYAVCQRARTHGVKVLMHGAGADELFGGYNRHAALKNLDEKGFLGQLGTALLLRNPTLPWQKLLGQYGSYTERIQQARLLDQPSIGALLRMQMAWPKEAWRSACRKGIKEPQWDKDLQQLLHHDQLHYLQRQVLMITDRASMAAQVEVRLPYLDDELSTWALSHPAEQHMTPEGKHLIKELLRHYGYGYVAQRPKEGFGINLDAWMRHDAAHDLLAPALKAESYLWQVLDQNTVKIMYDQHKKGEANYGLHLFTVLTWYWWEQAHS